MSSITRILFITEDILQKIKNSKQIDLKVDEELIIQALLEKEIYPFRVKVNYSGCSIEQGVDTLQYHIDEHGNWIGTKIKTINLL
jgi:hypothetical protein